VLDIENCRTIDKPPNTANAADLVNSAADLGVSWRNHSDKQISDDNYRSDDCSRRI
jgi:hypothetical protein